MRAAFCLSGSPEAALSSSCTSRDSVNILLLIDLLLRGLECGYRSGERRIQPELAGPQLCSRSGAGENQHGAQGVFQAIEITYHRFGSSG